MEIFGYIASVLIGISLGLIGGGGSILTVPVLVYLFGLEAITATEYSLFIVGISSTAGALSYFKRDLINFKVVLIFGIPSVISIFLTRSYIIPLIPEVLFNTGHFSFSRNLFLMLIFATLMIFASYSMIRKNTDTEPIKYPSKKNNILLMAGQGSIVGILTGLVGAGGGFMIIPALTGLFRTSMKVAIGTSLVIISLNSLIGFLSSMNHTKIDWTLLLTISLIAVAGIIIGSQISKKIDGKKLKPAFGWFILVMGIYIIVKEITL